MTANPAKPAPGVRLCALSELEDPGSRGFRFREADAIFVGFVLRDGDEVRGYVDSCPHAGWPLANMMGTYLTKTGQYVLCSGHGALFRPADGECVAGPCMGRKLQPWPVAVADGEVVTA